MVNKLLLLTGLCLGMVTLAFAGKSVLDYKLKTIDGQEQSLSLYKGKVMLLVNVASKCGLTPQYAALQALYSRYESQGLVILGFPANNFKGQEPGSHAEIKEFCSMNYGVTFPLFEKISVLGDDIHPLYRFLTDVKTNPDYSGEIKWNFTKFLVGRDGRILARFEPKTKPDSDEVIAAIEKALASQ